ncbi:stage II sporulation protein M [Nocardioides sp.]|uniref:stage II sporulation protein M n=1 Tax=Nocardioides sp. TaxID=35761 RepID=UPI002BF44FD9|nr:stage II sporulation protein M [Nocardioides sp.]HSX68858.1 stage II sporulation protein M [Nocardioides sp.]
MTHHLSDTFGGGGTSLTPEQQPRTTYYLILPEAAVGLALVLVPLALGTAVGASGIDASRAPVSAATNPVELAAHNLGIGGVALSGALTMGLTILLFSVPGWFIVGIDVGSAAREYGTAQTAAGLALHAPFEIAGFALLTAAGIAPLGHLVRVLSTRAPRWRDTARAALAATAAGTTLVCLAALIETELTPRMQTHVSAPAHRPER